MVKLKLLEVLSILYADDEIISELIKYAAYSQSYQEYAKNILLIYRVLPFNCKRDISAMDLFWEYLERYGTK